MAALPCKGMRMRRWISVLLIVAMVIVAAVPARPAEALGPLVLTPAALWAIGTVLVAAGVTIGQHPEFQAAVARTLERAGDAARAFIDRFTSEGKATVPAELDQAVKETVQAIQAGEWQAYRVEGTRVEIVNTESALYHGSFGMDGPWQGVLDLPLARDLGSSSSDIFWIEGDGWNIAWDVRSRNGRYDGENLCVADLAMSAGGPSADLLGWTNLRHVLEVYGPATTGCWQNVPAPVRAMVEGDRLEFWVWRAGQGDWELVYAQDLPTEAGFSDGFRIGIQREVHYVASPVRVVQLSGQLGDRALAPGFSLEGMQVGAVPGAATWEDLLDVDTEDVPLEIPISPGVDIPEDASWWERVLGNILGTVYQGLNGVRSAVAAVSSAISVAWSTVWDIGTVELELPDFSVGVTDRFPFSLPWDLYRLVAVFNVEPVRPEFTWDFWGDGTVTAEIVLPEALDGLASVWRSLFLIGWGVALMFATRRFMGGGQDW